MKFLMLLISLFYISGFTFSPIEESTISVTAENGATVWAICQEHYSNDVRSFEEFMYNVREENDLLNGKVLQAGQILVIRKKVRK